MKVWTRSVHFPDDHFEERSGLTPTVRECNKKRVFLLVSFNHSVVQCKRKEEKAGKNRGIPIVVGLFFLQRPGEILIQECLSIDVGGQLRLPFFCSLSFCPVLTTTKVVDKVLEYLTHCGGRVREDPRAKLNSNICFYMSITLGCVLDNVEAQVR